MDIGQYLQQNYPGVNSVQPVVVNGELKGYYAKGTNQIYIPVSALNNSSVGMLSYIPGAGGSGNDAAALRDRIFNNPPDYVITISPGCGDKNNCMESGFQTAQALGINVTNNVTVCFSASGYIGIDRTESFLRNHSNVKTTVFSCEPYPYGSNSVYNCSPDHIAAMKQNGTNIIFLTPQGFHINMEDELKTMGANGLNAYWMQTHYSGNHGGVHVATNRDLLNSGLIDYVLGYSDNFNKEPGNGYSPNYQFIGFDPKTGNLIYADYNELARAGIGLVRIPDLDALKKIDSFDIKTKNSPVQKKYNVLNTLSNMDITSKSGSVVSSEYVYVADAMNQIRSQIKSSSFLGGFQNLTFRSSDGIPGCIMGYLNLYFDIIGSLLNSLSMEADAVTSYGQAMVDMDEDLSKDANNVGEIVEIDQSSRYIGIGGLEAFEEKEETKPADTTTGATDTGTTNYRYDDSSGGSSGYSSYGGSSSSGSSSSEKQEEKKPEQKKVKREIKVNVPQEEPKKEEAPPQTAPAEATPSYVAPAAPEGGNTLPPEPAPPASEPAKPDIPEEGPMDEDMMNNIPMEPETTIPNYTKIPNSETPIVPNQTKKRGSGILPVVAGLSVAAAAGIGAKAYIDRKSNQNNEEVETEYEYENDYYDSDNDIEKDYEVVTAPIEEEQSYTARTSEELADMQ